MRSFTSLTGLVATLLVGGQLAAAHMEMIYPPPFRSKANQYATNVDFSMTSPLSNDGSNYPCKGYHVDLGTPAGKPTAEFAPGGTYNFTIAGGAAHNGGSCQAALSYDGGKTFTVIESIIGDCPLRPSFDFTVPSDAQTGTAIFSWTWFNAVGNRELYQNCAAVTIGSGGVANRQVNQRAAVAFSSRPQIFKANIGNGCTTLEGSSVVFPDPGPDVQNNGGTQQPPSGSCGAAAPGGGSGSVPDAPTTTAAAPTVPATTAPVAPPVEPPKTGNPVPTVEPPKPTNPGIPPRPTSQPTTAPGGIFLTISEATTFLTATKTASVAPPAPTTTNPAPGSGSGSGPSTPSTGANSGPCTNEGAWNCINGISFQRCASGQWSPVIPMAPGTTCTPGTSDSLNMRGRRGVRRFSA